MIEEGSILVGEDSFKTIRSLQPYSVSDLAYVLGKLAERPGVGDLPVRLTPDGHDLLVVSIGDGALVLE